jgi:hypothetical protein
MFKSAKQAEFLLSQCKNNQYVSSDYMFGSSFQIWYTCDANGITKVEKFTNAKGLVLQWEREESGKVSIQTTKEFKRLTRMKNGYVKSIISRQQAMDSGEYSSPIETFNSCMKHDQDSIATIESMLADLVN